MMGIVVAGREIEKGIILWDWFWFSIWAFEGFVLDLRSLLKDGQNNHAFFCWSNQVLYALGRILTCCTLYLLKYHNKKSVERSCSKASHCKYIFSLSWFRLWWPAVQFAGSKLVFHHTNPRVRCSSRPLFNPVFPMLCLCICQSVSMSNLNSFWQWCQFHLCHHWRLTACQTPTVLWREIHNSLHSYENVVCLSWKNYHWWIWP